MCTSFGKEKNPYCLYRPRNKRHENVHDTKHLQYTIVIVHVSMLLHCESLTLLNCTDNIPFICFISLTKSVSTDEDNTQRSFYNFILNTLKKKLFRDPITISYNCFLAPTI